MSVGDSPLTRASLLVQLRDGANHAAWQEFVQLYGPVVYGFARKRGLQDADAADLMQDVLRSVSTAIGRLDYDRNQGHVSRLAVHDHAQQDFQFSLGARAFGRKARATRRPTSCSTTCPDANDGADAWELEYQRRLGVAGDGADSEPNFKTTPGGRSGSRRSMGVPAADVAQQAGHVARRHLRGQEPRAGAAERRSRDDAAAGRRLT